MTDYTSAMRILHGSIRYEFDGTRLTLSDYYSGNEMVLDFENMTEEMFEEIGDEDVQYDDAMRILRGSKRYEFEDSILTVSDYRTGDEVKINLGQMTEEMYEEMSCEEDLDEDFDEVVSEIDMEENGMYR